MNNLRISVCAILAFLSSFSFANTQNIASLPEGLTEEWNEIKTGGNTRCARGEDYSFFVSPGKVNKVVIDFMGGGACWNSVTCHKDSATFNDTVDTLRKRHKRGLKGFYNRKHPENPAKDWYHVVIPYCTGDVHWGLNDQEYQGRDGTPFTIRHRGAANANAVLSWVTDHFSEPENILVTGCSAGAYGSIYWTPHIRKAYPNSQLVQFADSGAGIIQDGFFQQTFGKWQPTAYAPTWIPGLNPLNHDWNKLDIVDLYTQVGAFYPQVKLSQFSTAYDSIQTFFFEFMGGDAAQWSERLFKSYQQTVNQVDQFNYFIGPGDKHCILPYERFYNYESQNTSFLTWFDHFIHQRPVENVECQNCEL